MEATQKKDGFSSPRTEKHDFNFSFLFYCGPKCMGKYRLIENKYHILIVKGLVINKSSILVHFFVYIFLSKMFKEQKYIFMMPGVIRNQLFF